MCDRRDGVAAHGLIARSSFHVCNTSRFGVAEISNAGGRTKFSVTVALNVRAFLKYIHGQTIGRRRIDRDEVRFCGMTGANISNFLSAIFVAPAFT